jgi:hypothetical protein
LASGTTNSLAPALQRVRQGVERAGAPRTLVGHPPRDEALRAGGASPSDGCLDRLSLHRPARSRSPLLNRGQPGVAAAMVSVRSLRRPLAAGAHRPGAPGRPDQARRRQARGAGHPRPMGARPAGRGRGSGRRAAPRSPRATGPHSPCGACRRRRWHSKTDRPGNSAPDHSPGPRSGPSAHLVLDLQGGQPRQPVATRPGGRPRAAPSSCPHRWPGYGGLLTRASLSPPGGRARSDAQGLSARRGRRRCRRS